MIDSKRLILKILMAIMGDSEFLPFNPLSEIAAETFCNQNAKRKKREDGQEFCDNIFFSTCGPNTDQLNVVT